MRVVVERAQAPLFTELTLSLCVIRFMHETDDQFRAAHVSFTHEPDDVIEYAKVLRCPIRARASWNGVAIAKRTLEIPLRRRDPVLRSWLERQAGAILARLPAGADASDEVRSVLSTQATAGDMTIDAVARRLSTTPRTLQRRLARSGTSFETLRDDARRKAAELYLEYDDADDCRSDLSAGLLRADRVPPCLQTLARDDAASISGAGVAVSQE